MEENKCCQCENQAVTTLANGQIYCISCYQKGIEDERQAMGYYETESN